MAHKPTPAPQNTKATDLCRRNRTIPAERKPAPDIAAEAEDGVYRLRLRLIELSTKLLKGLEKRSLETGFFVTRRIDRTLAQGANGEPLLDGDGCPLYTSERVFDRTLQIHLALDLFAVSTSMVGKYCRSTEMLMAALKIAVRLDARLDKTDGLVIEKTTRRFVIADGKPIVAREERDSLAEQLRGLLNLALAVGVTP
jgi:hypothetical protein